MSITNPTEGRQYLAQAIRDSQRVDTIGDTVSFIVKVISQPVPRSSSDIEAVFSAPDEGSGESEPTELQDRLQFQGRIERGYFMSPHMAIPDPCDIYAASDTKIAAYQSLHLTCITPKGFSEPLKIGDRVRVTCRKGDFKMDLQFANVDSLETSFLSDDPPFKVQECSDLSELFGDGFSLLGSTPPDNSLDNLDPEFRKKLDQLVDALKARGFEPLIHETYRSEERQNWLYERGRSLPGPIVTDARDPSGHGHGAGKAADIIDGRAHPTRANEVIGWGVWEGDVGDEKAAEMAREYFKAQGEEAQKLGLVWGGKWVLSGGGNDEPHVQLA